MGVCIRCSATTEHRCKVCGGYLCATCWAATLQGAKDRAKGTAMCSAEAMVNDSNIIEYDPEEFPEPEPET